jgi:hypothetical protein
MKNTIRNLFLLPLAALMLLAPDAQAGKPGGVAVLLPPFVPVLKPEPFLYPVSPFDVIGFMQTATVDTPGDVLSGGTVEINGIKITVPRNTIFQMPAAAMTWGDLFINAPAAYKALNQSGLAMQDGNSSTPKPLTTYEIHVQGNRVINSTTDQYIAGLIFMSQQSANSGQGYINCIDYNKMEIWVSKPLQKAAPCTGARLRINTPNGRYGKPDPLADVRFTSDEDNPTIASRTGYPMCLPRFDPVFGTDSLCPAWNRPRDPFTGAFATIYTMSAAIAGVAGADGITHQVGYPSGQAVKPDPFEQVPLEVGDSITYAGSLVQDAPCQPGLPVSSCQYISAHTIADDIGIFTAGGSWPVYTFMSEFRIGVGGTPNPIFPQEALEKIFGDFFTTDNTQLVDIYAVDVNPCTGARTHRFYGTSDPFGPPVGGLKGRARFRSVIGNFLPPTREMAVASRSYTIGQPLDNVPVKLVANGLAAGQFQAPQFEFIFPENLIIGSQQIPLTFQEFPFLLNGSGPYVPFNAPAGTAAVNIGQLSPWPSLNVPAPSCTTGLTLLQPPTANAGSPQAVPSGATVNLNGSASVDGNNPPLPLIYTWQQSAGPAVNLLNAAAVNPQFIAPVLAAGTTATLTFQLAVCNGYTCGGLSSVNVTVLSSTTAPSVTLSASQTKNLAVGQAVTLTATALLGTAACPTCTFTFAQTSGPAQALTPNGNTATFTVAPLPAGTPTPAALTFTARATANGNSTTATITLYVGPDTITVINVVYKLSRSQFKGSVSDNVPNGAATLTMTPMAADGITPTGPAVGMIYDPVANIYNVLQDITNPIPNSAKFTSSFGAVVIAPIQRIQ